MTNHTVCFYRCLGRGAGAGVEYGGEGGGGRGEGVQHPGGHVLCTGVAECVGQANQEI